MLKKHVFDFDNTCQYCGVCLGEPDAELPCELAPVSAPDYIDPSEPAYTI